LDLSLHDVRHITVHYEYFHECLLVHVYLVFIGQGEMLYDENDAKKEELKIGTRRIVIRSDSALVMRNVGAGKGRNSVVGSEKTPGVKRGPRVRLVRPRVWI
jgi:hypothetical protein